MSPGAAALPVCSVGWDRLPTPEACTAPSTTNSVNSFRARTKEEALSLPNRSPNVSCAGVFAGREVERMKHPAIIRKLGAIGLLLCGLAFLPTSMLAQQGGDNPFDSASPEIQACLRGALGNEAFEAIAGTRRPPSVSEQAAIGSCMGQRSGDVGRPGTGFDRGAVERGAPGSAAQALPTEVLVCAEGALGQAEVAAIAAGQRRPSSEEEAVLGSCFERPRSGETSPAGTPTETGTEAETRTDFGAEYGLRPEQSDTRRGGRPGGQADQGRGACPDLDPLVLKLDQFIPDWLALKCNAASLARRPLPAFRSRVVTDPDGVWPGELDGLPARYVPLWDSLSAGFAMNTSPVWHNGMPPYATASGQPLRFPIDVYHPQEFLEIHDRAMRVISALLIREKQKGRLTFFSFGGPPCCLAPVFQTADEFRAWVRDVHLPRVRLEAQAAEVAKVDYYSPFPLETEMFLHRNLQPHLAALPPNELLRLAQEWIDQMREAIRPIYAGRLIGSAYHTVGEDPDFWANLSFAGYDELATTFMVACDVPTTRKKLERQLGRFVAMAARDKIPWSLGEMDVFRRYIETCQTNFDQVELDLYREVFRVLQSQPTPPAGLHITMAAEYLPNSPRLAGLQQVVNEYFRARGT